MSATLNLWSPTKRDILNEVFLRASQTPRREFAVFDADNTIWQHDISEALLAWLDYCQEINISDFPDSLLPIPPLPQETAISYYERLHDWDISTCYLWCVQALHNFSLADIRQKIKELLNFNKPIPVTMYQKGQFVSSTVPVPKIYPAQVQLIHALQEQEIDVWVVSASQEEVVRMVISDPVYGINLPPENVIGVNMILRDPEGNPFLSAHERMSNKTGFAYYFSKKRQAARFSSYLHAPATWYSGKVSAIKEWIHPEQKPFLVAGDSPNDFHMQFYANVKQGGLRLRVTQNPAHTSTLKNEIDRRANGQNG